MKRKLVAMLLCVCMVIALVPVSALAAEATNTATSGTTGDCTWKLEGTMLTISGNGKMADYTYSSSLPWGTGITEIIIEEGVTSVGNYSFYSCDSLTSATLPNGVTSIGANSFAFCTSLKSITIPNSIKSFGNSAFCYCYSLPGIIIPDGTTSIGSDTFYFCSKIKEITIPDSVKTIGVDAFIGCSIKSITIPDSVTSIGAGAFSYCRSLTSMEVDENNPTYYSSGNCIIKKATNGLVAGCSTSVIPDGIVTIEDSAFSGVDFVNIVLPNSVTKICGSAFSGGSITSITLPKSIDIAYGAFYLCDDLTDVYYSGNKTDRERIQIAGSNSALTDAKWHYAPCENDVHLYAYVCSTICTICEYERTGEISHAYDNDCDEKCNVCGESRISKHSYEKNSENTAICKVCNISKTFDFIITTDDAITLSYEATREFNFAVEDTAIAKMGNISNSIISAGSYYRQSSSVKVLPVFPGETMVKVVATNGTILASSSVLVVEGNHQLEFVEILKEPTYTETGTELHKCKFCEYEEEQIIACTQLRGDFDQDDFVTDADALYLLRHTLFADRYPISQNGDVDGDGKVTDADALYLLRHTLFPERYPLKP